MHSTLPAPVNDRPLRLSLRVDSVACAACVPLLVLGSGPLSTLLGLPSALLVGAGLVLLLFAAFLWMTASRPALRPVPVLAAIALNVLWVLGSVAVVALFSPTPWGVAFVLVQAVAVTAILVVEALALRRAGAERTTRGTV